LNGAYAKVQDYSGTTLMDRERNFGHSAAPETSSLISRTSKKKIFQRLEIKFEN
jgi:hypothetical protein